MTKKSKPKPTPARPDVVRVPAEALRAVERRGVVHSERMVASMRKTRPQRPAFLDRFYSALGFADKAGPGRRVMLVDSALAMMAEAGL